MARAAVRKGVCPPPSLLLPESPASRAVDFNSDGAFDAGDLPRWITGFGSTSALFGNGDGDADGDVDGADMLTWQRGFGTLVSEDATAKVASEISATENMPRDLAFASLDSLAPDGLPVSLWTSTKVGRKMFAAPRRLSLL